MSSSTHLPSRSQIGGALRRVAVGLVAAVFVAIMFMPSAPASAESGEILSTAQNGFAAGTRWHDWFCVGDEVCETGDVNADGRDDVVAFVRSSGTVWVALSEGTRFGPSSIWARGFCTGLRDCQVDDVTGDGRADAIWFDHTTGTMAFAASTGTAFGSVYSHREPNCTRFAACTTGDVDGDRDADIVVFSRITDAGAVDGRVHVSLAGWTCSAGTLRFDAFGRPLLPPPCMLTYSVPRQWHDHFCIWDQVCRVADLNGDGSEDIAAFMQNPAGTVYTALSSTAGPRFEANDTAGRDFCAAGSYCETGDLNGDGRHDLVSFAQRYTGSDDFREPLPGGDVFAMLARPDGALTGVDFGDVSLRIRPFCLTDAVCRTGDFNGDGKDDLVSFARDRSLASRGDVHVALSDFGKTTDWRLSAEGLRVVRSEEGTDEPYLEFISYRATVGVAGSAEVGISRLTPGAMPATIAEFDGVRLPTVGELLAGAPLEVMGAIVIAFDDDATSQDLIDIVIRRVATALEGELVRIVERGSVIAFATNPAALTDGLAEAERNIRAAARPSDFEAVVGWALSYFDLDDLIGVRVYTYIAVDKEVAALLVLRNDANTTSGVLGETLASHGSITRAFQCLEPDCRVSPSVRYDVTIGMHSIP